MLTPSPWKDGVPVVSDYQSAFAATNPSGNYAFLSMEAFLNAGLLSEGLCQAGRDLGREKLVAALEDMTDMDFGGFRVRLSPSNHVASRHVGPAAPAKDGRFLQ